MKMIPRHASASRHTEQPTGLHQQTERRAWPPEELFPESGCRDEKPAYDRCLSTCTQHEEQRKWPKHARRN